MQNRMQNQASILPNIGKRLSPAYYAVDSILFITKGYCLSYLRRGVILHKTMQLNRGKVFLFPTMERFQDLLLKLLYTPGTAAQPRHDHQERHKHAFPTDKSPHCNDLGPTQAGRWKDIGLAD